jgi:hypothetical protein
MKALEFLVDTRPMGALLPCPLGERLFYLIQFPMSQKDRK